MAKRDMPTNKTLPLTNETVNPKVSKMKETGEPILLKVSNCTSLNVRKSPSRDSQIMTIIKAGTYVQVVGLEEDGWFHISGFGDATRKSENSVEGYILAQYTEEV